ncbi:hypothetical protein [Marinomonas mediterranea]|jgi:hypothetical protein|uniref:Uncharacterized protein n=1 Tax=Marinomonas mediterranea (strain ATCC 700492 / JCM 21426 / NBRC 103028 / MMB-1) TaxID=717774 RepID=F2K0B2_MARM1|nr:hypothetical protein [Marinomonas mediterranea]ADZ89827.1 hypothetical protein Marme_0531 [Marinomonas mediterranea MMB-1]WCN07916.1 hypothetical protein GV055_02705 [Marinomonas mediterranea]WCN12011.1 hypothetical protein GV054_02715 [Marinomonas mediterranea]WCN16048.1 hypothetical protein GV053_02645 [Marinomonas mediterranea MMB-1]
MSWGLRVIVSLGLVLCQGCSNKQLYELIQSRWQYDCTELRHSQTNDCIAQHSMSYETYERYRTESNQGYR